MILNQVLDNMKSAAAYWQNFFISVISQEHVDLSQVILINQKFI